ncbi:hypothetical protein BKA82DRAFT_4342754 [Pisolithus tinctorius]|nr:hypothetical protein BKA82DRAFT_4342754 [Pisolithus tinctorius]
MLLVDDSVAYIIASLYLAAVPGNLSSEEHEACIPDSPYPFIFGLGTVTTHAFSLPDGVTKAFLVTLSDFVHNVTMSSTVVTPVPNLNMTVLYTDHFCGAAPADRGVQTPLPPELSQFSVGNIDVLDVLNSGEGKVAVSGPKGKGKGRSCFLDTVCNAL